VRDSKRRRPAKKGWKTGLTQPLRSSRSRIAKMEAGDPTVSLDLLVKQLPALGTANEELAAIIAKR